MQQTTHSTVTEPANRGLRLLFALLSLVLLAACASSKGGGEPPANPEPPPLTDRTADSDYRLQDVAEKLRDAEELEYDGHRALAVAVVGTAQQMLPADFTREHDYLDVVKATIWAREGDGQNADKARELLDAIRKSATERKDRRLLSDVELVQVVLLLSSGDKVGAARAGDQALRDLTAEEAHVQAIRAARNLAFQFNQAGDKQTARTFARRAYETAERIEDDELWLQTCLDVGRIEITSGTNAERYFLQAYEASYRLNSVGWRNVVISLAVDSYFGRDDMQACVRWGDRLRDYDEAELPSEADSGLYSSDYIMVMAQYSFALRRLDETSPRRQEAIRNALKSIAALPKEEQEGWMGLAEKLSAGLLQPEGEK
ncbi:MAG: hypothetical protein H6839_04865 [Planctomycetes bacterium]|nr:hypothetical protein [Planctomycetota bacterium]